MSAQTPPCPASEPQIAIESSGPAARANGRRAMRALAMPVLSMVLFFVVRPFVGSDAAGLAISGALPTAYLVVTAITQRKADPWAALTVLGFALACVATLLAGGSSLPLKLHEAAVTFVLGVVLLVAVLVRRPLRIGALLKVPAADRGDDAALSVMVGGFLVLHALLHLALALTMSTTMFLTVGRVVSWGTLAVGGFALYAYLRRLRQRS
jgi:hypothetical protein